MSAPENLGDLLDVAQHPTLTIPDAGRVLGVGRSQSFELARTGVLPIIRLSPRRAVVSTAALRVLLGLDVTP